MAKVVTISGVDFPCRQLKWKEMRELNRITDPEESNARLYALMKFTEADLAKVDDLVVGDVYQLNRELFVAATAPTAAEVKN